MFAHYSVNIMLINVLVQFQRSSVSVRELAKDLAMKTELKRIQKSLPSGIM